MVTQARAATTRQNVLIAAAVVFEQHGYAAATISQILEAAGVTRGSLYFHFDSKEALAHAIIAEQTNWRDTNSLVSNSPLQQLVDLSYRFANALQSDPMVRASIRLTMEQGTFAGADDGAYAGWLSSVRQLLTDAEAAGQLLPGVKVDRAAYVVISAVTGIQLVSEAMSARSDLCARMDDLWTLVLRGLAPAKVISRLALHQAA